MRPPILFLTVAFGVGLWAGLDPFVFPGAALWGVAVSLAAASAWLARRAPLGAAVGVMGVAGKLLGAGAGGGKEAPGARPGGARGTRPGGGPTAPPRPAPPPPPAAAGAADARGR